MSSCCFVTYRVRKWCPSNLLFIHYLIIYLNINLQQNVAHRFYLLPLSPHQEVGCGASLGVISESLLVTGGQGCVSFWDLNFGDLLQTVYLGQSSDGQGVRQLLVLDNAAIVCDFGSELSLVYVPSVLEKLD